MVNETDGLDQLVTDLRGDRRIDPVQRRLIVDEMKEWMFIRPVHDGVRAASSPA